MDTVMHTVLYLVANAIHVYAVFLFMDRFLSPPRFSAIGRTLPYIGYYVLGSISWLLLQNSTLNIILNVALPLLLTLCYRVSWKRRFFAAFFTCAVGMMVDWGSATFLGESVFITTDFMQSLVIFIAAVIFHFVYHHPAKEAFRSPYLWLLVLITLCTMIIAYLLIDESSHGSWIALILLAINFFNFYVYQKNRKLLEEQYRSKMMETVNRAYRNTIQRLEEKQKNIRFMHHDLAKHIRILSEYADRSEWNELKAYLKEMAQNTAEEEVYAQTGNEEADSLINYELTQAKQLGAEILSHIALPAVLQVSPFDMTIILGNLLDNAVHALESVDKKILKMDMCYSKGIIRIKIENTYSEDAPQKSDGQEHGLGLAIVEETAQKLGGKLVYRKEDGVFYVNVSFYDGKQYAEVAEANRFAEEKNETIEDI